MASLPWALFSERAIGRSHPTLADVVNRPLRALLSGSGYDPDVNPFPGLMGPVFNVKAFGAKGDGVTNDAPAIQAALDAADVGGGIVFMPAGIFKCGSRINMRKVHLTGVGIDNTGFPGTKLIFDAGLSGLLCDFAGRSCVIENLMVDSAQQQTGTIGIEIGDDVNNGTGNSRITNVVFRNFGTNLRVRGGADAVYVNECHFWSALVNHVKIGRPLGGPVNTPTGINLMNCFFNDLAPTAAADLEYGESNSNRFVNLDFAANDIPVPAILFTAGARRVSGYGVHVEHHTVGLKFDGGTGGNSTSHHRIYGFEYTPVNATDLPVHMFRSTAQTIVDLTVASASIVTTAVHIQSGSDPSSDIIIIGDIPTGKVIVADATARWSLVGYEGYTGPTAARRIDPTFGASISIDGNKAGYIRITATSGIAFTINNPTNVREGQFLTFHIANFSGGAMGAITWGSNFHLAGAFVNPANTKTRTITFGALASNSLLEISRVTEDIG